MDAESVSGDGAVKDELTRTGERTAELLRAAGETAEGIQADAEEFAQATRGAAYRFAQEHRAEAKADADRTKAEARAEADRILQEAHRQRGELEAVNAHLTERRDHLIAQLDQLSESASGLADAHRPAPDREPEMAEEGVDGEVLAADPLDALGAEISAEEGDLVPAEPSLLSAEPGEVVEEAAEKPKRRFSSWLPPRRRDFESDSARRG